MRIESGWWPGAAPQEVVEQAEARGGAVVSQNRGDGISQYRIMPAPEKIRLLRTVLFECRSDSGREAMGEKLTEAEQAYAAWRRQMISVATYADSGSEWEARMRVDYARVVIDSAELGREDISREEFHALMDRVDTAYATWTGPDAPAGAVAAWAYLEAAVHDWRRFPDTMGQAAEVFDRWHHQGLKTLDPVQWRSLQQARELTWNGAMEHEPDRADGREGHLATGPEHTRVNAFAAAAAAGVEREGTER